MLGFTWIAFLLFSCVESTDPATVLARARQRLLADLARLPRYTCVETITRNNYAAPLHWHSPSCAEIVAEHDKRKHELKLSGWDRLRLDVAVGAQGEIYSWVGAPKFEEDTLEQLAGRGALGSGDFGPFVNAIFTQATIKFQEEQVVQGRRLLTYSYDMPESVSNYQIYDNSRQAWYTTAYSGTFVLDAEGPDLVQFTSRTAELRLGTEKCQAINEVEYARVAIHGSQVLIPRETRLRIIGRAGEESLNLTSYANCREYSSKAVLRFDVPAVNSNSKSSSSVLPASFPPGLSFQWRMVTPIDSDTAAAGDVVEAVLRSSIREKNGQVLAPSGTRIHGRLTQFFHSDGLFGLSLKFESIDVQGTTVPFSAALASNDKFSSVRLHAAKPSELAPGPIEFRFRTEHLKLTKLESSGRTALSQTEKNEEPKGSSR